MIGPLAQAASSLFQYPAEPHRRRHGPRGYTSYRSYKPWLRDEFCFRCVYCLCREQWEPNGQDAFSVEHLRSQVTDPLLATDYENMIYACSICNAYRGDELLPFDPCDEAMATHLRVLGHGTVEARTIAGEQLIEICHLNRPALIEFRNYLLDLTRLLVRTRSTQAVRTLQRVMGFPSDLPNLANRRPPGGNNRPDGIGTSYLERRKRGDLPGVYG